MQRLVLRTIFVVLITIIAICMPFFRQVATRGVGLRVLGVGFLLFSGCLAPLHSLYAATRLPQRGHRDCGLAVFLAAVHRLPHDDVVPGSLQLCAEEGFDLLEGRQWNACSCLPSQPATEHTFAGSCSMPPSTPGLQVYKPKGLRLACMWTVATFMLFVSAGAVVGAVRGLITSWQTFTFFS